MTSSDIISSEWLGQLDLHLAAYNAAI